MDELRGRVAVITGAGSGFGREFARLCGAEGMRLVLADRNPEALGAVAQELREGGVPVEAVTADVARYEEVEALAARTYATFGAAHLVFNNAGVALPPLPAWEHDLEDWRYVHGPNLWGVIHGIRAFVPRMIAAGTPGHIVNTASAAGLVSVGWQAGYCASKHAVVALSECLYRDLHERGHPIGVSVLCPAWVRTGIGDSSAPRARPSPPPDLAHAEAEVRRALDSSRVSATEIARLTLEAVRGGYLYVIPHAKILGAVRQRMEDIMATRNPDVAVAAKQPRT